MLQVHAWVEGDASRGYSHRDSSRGRAGRRTGGDIDASLGERVVHGGIAARPRALGGHLRMVGSVHCWLLRSLLLLVMVGHAGEVRRAYGEEDVLLVLGLRLGLRLLDLMLRGAVRGSVRGSAVGRLLMLIYRRPRGRPGRRLRTLRGRRSHVKGGSAVSVVARRDLQSLRDVGYALRE